MREDINFEELIDKIDFILNSSKPLPHYMREERELAELVKHLKEIPKYETLKQFELLFDVEPFLMHFLAGTDFTELLKIIDRTTMKYKHLDGYTPLMMIVVNPNITNFEKTVVIDRLIEMGCDVNRPNDFGETALMMAVKRNNRKMMEYLLENGANPNISDNLGVKTLDKVIIEMSKGAFASGQLYVALSRTRHKADIHIPKRIDESDAIIDDRIVEFLG